MDEAPLRLPSRPCLAAPQPRRASSRRGEGEDAVAREAEQREEEDEPGEERLERLSPPCLLYTSDAADEEIV